MARETVIKAIRYFKAKKKYYEATYKTDSRFMTKLDELKNKPPILNEEEAPEKFQEEANQLPEEPTTPPEESDQPSEPTTPKASEIT